MNAACSVATHLNTQDSPVGQRLCESYQNFDEEGSRRSQLSLSHIGERFGKGWMFLLVLFFAPKQKDKLGF